MSVKDEKGVKMSGIAPVSLDLISLSIGIALIEKKCSECTKAYQSCFQRLSFYVAALVACMHVIIKSVQIGMCLNVLLCSTELSMHAAM